MKSIAPSLALLLAIAVGTPAAQAKVAKKSETGKIVCRLENVTGSRLGQNKRCLTSEEWADLALRDRQALDRNQTQRYPGNQYAGSAGSIAFGRSD